MENTNRLKSLLRQKYALEDEKIRLGNERWKLGCQIVKIGKEISLTEARLRGELGLVKPKELKDKNHDL